MRDRLTHRLTLKGIYSERLLNEQIDKAKKALLKLKTIKTNWIQLKSKQSAATINKVVFFHSFSFNSFCPWEE